MNAAIALLAIAFVAILWLITSVHIGVWLDDRIGLGFEVALVLFFGVPLAALGAAKFCGVI